MPRGQSRGCPICESVNRALLCNNCVNNQVFNEKHKKLQDLLRQKDELQQRVEELLAKRKQHSQQQFELWEQQQQTQDILRHRNAAAQKLAAMQQQVQQLAASNQARRSHVDLLSKQIAKTCNDVLTTELPRVLRYHELTLTHVRAQLAREQKHRLRELQEIFPLRINAVSQQGGPIQITICNLRLPDSLVPPPNGWPDPQAMSAALGYLLFFIDKVAMYIGGPLLHEAQHQGSTSSIWTPAGFWNRAPASAHAVLPLHVMGSSGSSGTGASSSSVQYSGGSSSSSGRSYARSASLWIRGGAPPTPGAPSGSTSSGPGAGVLNNMSPSGGFLSLSPKAPAAGAGGGTPGIPRSGSSGSMSGSSSGGMGVTGKLSKRDAEVKAAWDLLMRSLRCYLKDKSNSRGLQLPPAWHPVAWLCIFCAAIKKDLRSDGRLVATAAAGAAAAAAVAAAEAAGGSPTLVAAVAAAAGEWWGSGAGEEAGHQEEAGWQLEDDDDEDDDEGWGMVRTPWLPPPPSQPDEVEQWARAMFTDPNASSSSAVLTGVVVGSPPVGSGMMSIERIRSMFGKS